MFHRPIAAVLLGGLLLAPIPAAMAQTTNVAYATPQPPRNYVVFFESGTTRLSNAAMDVVRHAAQAANSASKIRVVGRADHAETVKSELVRAGVPAASIVIATQTDRPLPKVGDGLSDPSRRTVQIIM